MALPEHKLYPGSRPAPKASPARGRRPNFPTDFKLRLVELSMQPGANGACIARGHGINDNLLFNWRHLWKQGRPGASGETTATLFPVSLTPSLPDEAPVDSLVTHDDLLCEVVLCGDTIRLQGAVTPALLQCLISGLKGGIR